MGFPRVYFRLAEANYSRNCHNSIVKLGIQVKQEYVLLCNLSCLTCPMRPKCPTKPCAQQGVRADSLRHSERTRPACPA